MLALARLLVGVAALASAPPVSDLLDPFAMGEGRPTSNRLPPPSDELRDPFTRDALSTPAPMHEIPADLRDPFGETSAGTVCRPSELPGPQPGSCGLPPASGLRDPFQ